MTSEALSFVILDSKQLEQGQRGVRLLKTETGVAATPFGQWVAANKRALRIGPILLPAAPTSVT